MPEKSIILFLDDEKDSREDICEGLKQYDIRTVGTVSDLWRLLNDEQLSPDLFLIDWVLSESDEDAASRLIKELGERYPGIPRVVLTAGQGRQGSARIIAELRCGYIEKGAGFDAIGRLIDQTLSKSIVKRDSSPVGVMPDISATVKPTKEIGAATVEETKSEYGAVIDVLEVRKKELEEREKALTKNLQELQEREESLALQVTDLESARGALVEEMSFFERFRNISRSIVNPEIKLPQLAAELLPVLIEYTDTSCGAILFFREDNGVFLDSAVGHPKPVGEKSAEKTIKLNTIKSINVGDICKLADLTTFTQQAIRQASEGKAPHSGAQIISDFRNNLMFRQIRLVEVASRSNLLIIPIEMNGNASGAILLFDKTDRRAFGDEDLVRLDQLPLSNMISGAQEMPFRTYDQKGWFKYGLSWICRQASRIPKVSIRRKPLRLEKTMRSIKAWEFKQGFYSTYMEVLRLSVTLISIAVLAIPSYYIVKHFMFDIRGHKTSMQVLNQIELLLMLLTFVLFALGLVVLFEPNYARGLPKWMLSFTRISTLEGTLLRLVVIILAIDLLSRFLVSGDSALELFLVTFSVCLITIAVGVFIKYFLHESVSQDDDG